MKKNGFIATSLIYSFFLIFITLFLSVIADYLQDKVLLNEIEKGIKSDINDSMGIRDFEVGDLIVFGDNECTGNFISNNAYVVANTDVLNNKLVLYSYSLCDNSSNSCSNILLNFDDILSGYQNATYYNNIIYNFDKTTNMAYKVGNEYYSLNTTNCDNNASIYNTYNGCKTLDNDSTFVRQRIEYIIDSRIERCLDIKDAMGAIYLKGNL